MSNMLRKLRIAFSVVCGIVCLLMVLLWLRSYSYEDRLAQGTSSRLFRIYSWNGRLAFEQIHPDRNPKIRRSGVGPIILKDLSSSRFINSDPITGSGTFLGDDRVGFGRLDQDISTSVFVPYWFPVLVAAICTVLPWVPWSRRFRLRTLLFATAIVALLLAAIVYG
jgi:hypothetical protein